MVTERQLGKVPELQAIRAAQPPIGALADTQTGPSPVEPAVQLTEKLPQDWKARLRAADFIKGVAMGNVYVDPAAYEAPNTSLKTTLDRKRDGDEEAGRAAWMNVITAVTEAVFKKGHVTGVGLKLNKDGHWTQFGSAMLHVHANALKTESVLNHSGLMDRTKAETVVGIQAEEFGREGILEDKYLFKPSLFPAKKEVSYDIATNEAGFFDKYNAVLQLFSTNGDDAYIDSAFVAGVHDEVNGEAEDQRFDIEVMQTIYFLAGVDATGWQPIDFLRNPLVIDKKALPNGAADLYELWNQIAKETTGRQVAESINPVTFADECREREQKLEAVADRVMDQLSLKTPELKDDASAVTLLAKLVGPAVVEHVLLDTSFDSGVFGEEAAFHIEAARAHHAAGNLDLMAMSMQSARETAVVTMCGVTTSLNEEQLKEAAMNTLRGRVTNTESDESGDCEYMSKECPLCHTKNVLTKSTKTKIEGDCGCWLDKVSNKAHVSAKPNIAARRNNAHLN